MLRLLALVSLALVFTGVAGAAPKKRFRTSRRSSSRSPFPPPTVTPRLGESGYVFPVYGNLLGDTYGAGAERHLDGWHHGDDLFAPLGTPIVAVAHGELSPIGWDGLGGWRLWLTDDKGNSFYYAHLAGVRAALHHGG